MPRHILSLALFSIATMTVPTCSSAAVTYDNGQPQRPLSVSGLTLVNGTYTATYDYGVSFGDSVIDQEAITGSTDAAVIAEILQQLNSTGVDSSPTAAYVSVTDASPGGDASVVGAHSSLASAQREASA